MANSVTPSPPPNNGPAETSPTETNGRFHILKLNNDGVTQLDHDELKVADGRYAEFYGSPAVAYGRIYFATEGGVYCIGNPKKPDEARSRIAASASRPKTIEDGQG